MIAKSIALVLAASGPSPSGPYWLMDFDRGCREVDLAAAMRQVNAVFRSRKGLRIERFTDEGADVIRVVYVIPGATEGYVSVYTSDRRHCLRNLADYASDAKNFEHGGQLSIGYQSPRLAIKDVTNSILPPPLPASAYAPSGDAQSRGAVTLKPHNPPPPARSQTGQ